MADVRTKDERRKTKKMRREFRWGYDFFRNTERNTSKTPNEIPQKHRTKYLKNTERNTSKTPILLFVSNKNTIFAFKII